MEIAKRSVAVLAVLLVGTGLCFAQAMQGYESADLENAKQVASSATQLAQVCATTEVHRDLRFMVFNAAKIPADGAVSPAICGELAGIASNKDNRVCYTPKSPLLFGTGLAVLVSSGKDCGTKVSPPTASVKFLVRYRPAR